MDERNSGDRGRKRSWVSPKVEEMGRFHELTQLQTTAECTIGVGPPGCEFFFGPTFGRFP